MFERIDENGKDLIERINKELKERFGITAKMLKLASMHETSKNHKTPPSIRFITAAFITILLELAESELGLKEVIAQLRKKCNTLHRTTGVRRMWFMDSLYIQPAAELIKTHKVTAVEAMHPTLSKQKNRKVKKRITHRLT